MELSLAFKDCTNKPKLLILPLQQREQKGLFHWLLAWPVHHRPSGENSRSDLLPAVSSAAPAHARIVTAATGKQKCLHLSRTMREYKIPNKDPEKCIASESCHPEAHVVMTPSLMKARNVPKESHAVQKGKFLCTAHLLADVIHARRVCEQYNAAKDTSSLYMS